MNDLADMSHEKKCCLFVVGAFKWLADNKLVVGGFANVVTAKGIAYFDQLEQDGFRPNEADTRSALTAMMTAGGYKPPPALALNALVTMISNWDRLKQYVKDNEPS